MRPGTLSRHWRCGSTTWGTPQTAVSRPPNTDLVSRSLQAISRLERPHLWSDDKSWNADIFHNPRVIHEYRNRLDELFADNIRHYMVDPAGMKKVAPVAAASSETWSTPLRSAR
jgi:hypothetical protein